MTDNKTQKPAKTKAEAAPKAKEEKKAAASPKLKKLVEEVEKLSVLELAELVKALEDKFGISAAQMVAAAPAAGGNGNNEAQEEKSKYDIILKSAGSNKIAAIKAVREINPELGLKEAKDLVEAAPKELKTGVKKEDAQEAKKKLEAAGAEVELK